MDKHCVAITLTDRNEQYKCNTTITDPLVFNFDREDVLKEDFTQHGGPVHNLNGMSGCPAVRVHVFNKDGKNYAATCLEGIFVEYHKDSKEAVVSDCKHIKILCEELI